MKREAILEKVRQYILNQLDVSKAKLTEDALLVEDLGADSANLMMLIMDLEAEFDTTVEDDAIANIKTIGNIVDYIQKRIG